MQQKSRQSNAERSQLMRARLLDVARTLFVERGYHETSTPEIAKAAKVTRGALYHHFEDKLALFRAVVEREADNVATAIENKTRQTTDAKEAIDTGSDDVSARAAQSLPDAVQNLEVQALRKALKRARYRQAEAARLLGLTYHQFRRLYRKYQEELAKGE